MQIHMKRKHSGLPEKKKEKKIENKNETGDTSTSKDTEGHDAYKCDTCPAIFISRSAALKHMSNEHDDEDSVTESTDSDDNGEKIVANDDSTNDQVDLQEDECSDDEIS